MYEEATSTLDLIQEYLEVTGWNFARQSENVITFEYTGDWNAHQFLVAEKPASSTLLIQCQINFTIADLPPVEILSPSDKKPSKKRQRKIAVREEARQVNHRVQVILLLRELCNMIHADMPLGTFHFSLPPDQTVLVFWTYRVNRSVAEDPMVLQDMLNEALAEIDEFYPAFNLVLTGTVTAADAYDTAIPDVYGTA